MKKLIRELLSFIIIGIVILLPVMVFYIYSDPFKIIYNYKSYFKSGEPSFVTLNKDYVSTQTLINNSKLYKYDSFIFGNSRSMFYMIDTWKKYILDSNCYHFDASGESLYGINKKFNFLKSRGYKISHALVILDNATLGQLKEKEGHLFLSHPLLSNKSFLVFHVKCFLDFLSPNFLRAYIDFKINGKFKDYMKYHFLLSDVPLGYNLKYNEIRLDSSNDQIKNNPGAYYNKKKMEGFYLRDSSKEFSPPIVYGPQIYLLENIAKILRINNAEYKIIINPLYDQVGLNERDVLLLERIFGKKNVFNFSGPNWITKDYHNYYENSHYRPFVADSILKIVYKIP